MKKIFLFILLIGLFATNGIAQTRIGAGVAYGTTIRKPGINIRGEFSINEKLSIGGSYTIFGKDSRVYEIINIRSSNWYETNVNVNYMLFCEEKFDVYALGGASLVTIYNSLVFPQQGTSESWTTRTLGLNLGGGVRMTNLGKFQPFSEVKYNFGNADQLTVVAGLLFSLG